MFLKIILKVASLILLASVFANGQETITLKQASFECTPKRGTNISPVKGWFDCGRKNFPSETPPDIHPAGLWENTLPASEGNSYLGLVVRDNESWESVSQVLSMPMKSGNCYEISLEIAQSSNYWSGSKADMEDFVEKHGKLALYNAKLKKHNYVAPTVLRIWGGNSYCDAAELLAESSPVSASDWNTYHFKFHPKHDCKFLIFEAFYKTPVLIPYNGHILLDNISEITSIDCDKPIVAITEFTREEKEILVINDPVPLKHKNRKKKKTKKKTQTTPKPNKIIKKDKPAVLTYDDPTKKEPPHHGSFSHIDKNKIKKGQIIELEKVYFKSDTTSINPSSFEILDELYEFLQENQNLKIEVGGHTNSTPSNNYCDQLSTARAKTVADYLKQKGIANDRITYKGYGKRKPIASNRTKKGRKKNQRVEIKVIAIR